MTGPSLDPERRSLLLRGKVTGIAKARFDAVHGEASSFPDGASYRDGSRGWVLVDAGAQRALGPALAWAAKNDITELHLVGSDRGAAGLLARRALAFVDPPSVWWTDGAELRPAEPAPLPPRPPAPFAPDLEGLLLAAGLDVVEEYGYLAGELNGLEIARIVEEPVDPLLADGPTAPVLQVGVGAADRELTALLHAGLPPDAALERAVEIVSRLRRPGAERHPIAELVPERWLRRVVEGRPQMVGLDDLRPVPPPLPRGGLREQAPAFAAGRQVDGSTVVVAFSVGVDLDVIPAAAEARAALDPEAPLLLVTPGRDLLAVTERLAARLERPAALATVGDAWRV